MSQLTLDATKGWGLRCQPDAGACSPSVLLLAFGFLVLLTLSARAQLVTQTFQLRHGWNSIWLDLEPTNASVHGVFAGTPLVSVWTFAERNSAVDYIEDLNEPVWNKARWLVHVPTNRLESFQNSLFSLSAKRAYLVHLTNAFTLQVTGRPVWRQRAWAADAYTLRGLPVDPERAPDFNTFFLPSRAHFDLANGRLQKIYRLSPLGQWSLVQAGERIVYGEAYWIFTKGGSDYVAPLDLKLDTGDGIDFGAGLTSVTLELANRSGDPMDVMVRDTTTTTPLSYQRFSSTNAIEWLPLPAALANPLESGAARPLRLAMRRHGLTDGSYRSVVEIKDGLGTRFQLSVSARTFAAAGRVGEPGTPAPGNAASLAGLWVGNATIQAVSEVNSHSDPVTPTPTANAFHLRLVLHVDESGMTHLLKEVVQLWQNGTATNDASGELVLATPGRYVLATDDRLFAQFEGATLRDGTPAGRRISTVGFDFPNGLKVLPLTGSFGSNATLSGSITLGTTAATNPFRHKFHPDHAQQIYEVTRQISLQFSNAAPAGVPAIDYGYSVQAGTYRESVSGLNKNPISCQGPFRLTRVSEVGVLNE